MSYSTGAVIAAWGNGAPSKIPDHAVLDAIAFTPDHKNLVVVDGAARTYVLTVGGVFLRYAPPFPAVCVGGPPV